MTEALSTLDQLTVADIERRAAVGQVVDAVAAALAAGASPKALAAELGREMPSLPSDRVGILVARARKSRPPEVSILEEARARRMERALDIEVGSETPSRAAARGAHYGRISDLDVDQVIRLLCDDFGGDTETLSVATEAFRNARAIALEAKASPLANTEVPSASAGRATWIAELKRKRGWSVGPLASTVTSSTDDDQDELDQAAGGPGFSEEQVAALAAHFSLREKEA